MIDATPHIRRDVVRRLATLGLLRWRAPSSLNESWVVTDAGRDELGDEGRAAAGTELDV